MPLPPTYLVSYDLIFSLLRMACLPGLSDDHLRFPRPLFLERLFGGGPRTNPLPFALSFLLGPRLLPSFGFAFLTLDVGLTSFGLPFGLFSGSF